jgi:hypothetical protein
VGKGPFNVFQDITLCALDIICGKTPFWNTQQSDNG